MTEVQFRLREFAETKCVPYLLNLPRFASSIERLSFVLVGSVATGLCRENSDIDIAVVCDKDTYEAISNGTEWAVGRPSETRIDGVQLHYYAITFDEIEAKLQDLDDVYLYVYSNAIVLHDPRDRYIQRLGSLSYLVPDVRKQRIEGKLDMLLRRYRALKSCLREGDILTIGKICLELVTLCLKVIALLDDVPFDPRKRLFRTALKGRIGRQMEDGIRQLFLSLGILGQLKDESDFAKFEFTDRMSEIIDTLSREAAKQHFQVGLAKSDRRHHESAF